MGTVKQVAVFGGRGMLGTDLFEILMSRGLVPVTYDLPELDLRNAEHLEMALQEADIAVNCAAYTDVDGAESNAETAFSVNAAAVGMLGKLAAEKGVPVLHISSDFVFDGKGEHHYKEDDPTGPLNVYGASKLKGEQLLEQSGCRYCIVRLQWTYGIAGNNFIKKILERCRNGRPLKVVDDQVGAPTSTREAARVLTELLLQPDGVPEGIFHFAAGGYASRFEVARFAIGKMGLDAEVAPCKSREFITPARRPLNSRFNCQKIAGFLSEPIKPWQIPLEHYLEQLS